MSTQNTVPPRPPGAMLVINAWFSRRTQKKGYTSYESKTVQGIAIDCDWDPRTSPRFVDIQPFAPEPGYILQGFAFVEWRQPEAE